MDTGRFHSNSVTHFHYRSSIGKKLSFGGGGSKNAVGKIDGSTISAWEYSTGISNYEDGLKMINPNIQINDQVQAQIQQEVWNTIASNRLLEIAIIL